MSDITKLLDEAKDLESNHRLDELKNVAGEIIAVAADHPEGRRLLVKVMHDLENEACIETLKIIRKRGIIKVRYDEGLQRDVIEVEPRSKAAELFPPENSSKIIREEGTPLVDAYEVDSIENEK